MPKFMPRLLLGLILALALTYAAWQVSRSRTFQFFDGLVHRVETSEKAIALTFDDGPTPGRTEEILGILDRLGVKTTFFLTGREMESHPELAGMIAAAGHQIGNHTYSHRRMLLKSPAFIRSEIERTDALIRAAGYRGEILFRMPGCKRLLLLPWYLWRNHRVTVTWDIEPNSFPAIDASAARIVQYVSSKARPGSIILLHVMYEGRKESRRAVEGIVQSLQRKGYSFVTLDELLAKSGRWAKN